MQGPVFMFFRPYFRWLFFGIMGECFRVFLGGWGALRAPKGHACGGKPPQCSGGKAAGTCAPASSARKQELLRPGHICAGNSFSGVPCPVFSLHTKSRPAALRLRTACRPGRGSIYPAVPRSAGPGSGYRFLSAPWWAWNYSSQRPLRGRRPPSAGSPP